MSFSICDSHIGTSQLAHFGWKIRFGFVVKSDFRIEVNFRRHFANNRNAAWTQCLASPLSSRATRSLRCRRAATERCNNYRHDGDVEADI